MGTFEIIILAICGLCIFFGIIGGIGKGTARSFIRLLTVAASAVGALLLEPSMTNYVIGIQIKSSTLKEFLLDMVCQGDLAKVRDQIWPILQILISVVVFLVTFFLLLVIVSWIVYGILKLVFIHGNGKKNRFFGLLIGIVNGALAAIVFANVLTGLSFNVEKIAAIEYDGKPILETVGVQSYYDELSIEEYNDSKEAEWFSYKLITKNVYDRVATATIDGKTYTLDSQTEGLKTAIAIANAVSSLSEADFSSGITTENSSEIADVLRNIGDSYSSLDDESKELIDGLVDNLSETLGIDASDLDLDAIDFNEAADLVETAGKIGSGDYTSEDVDAMLESALDSGAVDLLTDADVELTLDSEQAAEVSAKIETMDATDEEKAKLKELFGIE